MSDIANSIENAGAEADTDKEIDRLAKLSPIDYERVRAGEGKRLGMRTTVLDAEVEKRRKAGAGNDNPDRQGRAIDLPEPEPWPEPVDGAELLDDIVAAVRRFVILPGGGAEAIALWAVHAHAIYAAHFSPLLAFSSPEKRCGKTTALKVVARLVPKPIATASISPAALFRSIEKWRPSLMIDEADTFMKDNEDLRGILNSGHTRDQYLIRCEPDTHEPVMFDAWGPKAVALIGSLPDTLEDRSIAIRMNRKTDSESAERLRGDMDCGFGELVSKCARWVADNLDRLKACDPSLPSALHDRAKDNWSALFAIADVAGGHWPGLSRDVAIKLSPAGTDDKSIRVQLLDDIQTVFTERNTDKISSVALCDALAAMEDRPWCEWGRSNKPIKPSSLARQLQHFGIAPNAIRIGTEVVKGYDQRKFGDLFTRYLHTPSDAAVTRLQVNETAAYREIQTVTPDLQNTQKVTQNSSFSAGCNRVTAGNRGSGDQDTIPASNCAKCGAPLYTQDKGITWLIDNGEARHKQCPSDDLDEVDTWLRGAQ